MIEPSAKPISETQFRKMCQDAWERRTSLWAKRSPDESELALLLKAVRNHLVKQWKLDEVNAGQTPLGTGGSRKGSAEEAYSFYIREILATRGGAQGFDAQSVLAKEILSPYHRIGKEKKTRVRP